MLSRAMGIMTVCFMAAGASGNTGSKLLQSVELMILHMPLHMLVVVGCTP